MSHSSRQIGNGCLTYRCVYVTALSRSRYIYVTTFSQRFFPKAKQNTYRKQDKKMYWRFVFATSTVDLEGIWTDYCTHQCITLNYMAGTRSITALTTHAECSLLEIH